MRILLSSLLVGASLAAIAAPAWAQSVIRADQTVTGALQASDRVLDDGSHYDCYRLQATPGRPLNILLRSTDFDAYLAVVDGSDCASSGVPHSDDDSGGGTNALISFTPGNGTYSIRANSLSSGETGAYQLILEIM